MLLICLFIKPFINTQYLCNAAFTEEKTLHSIIFIY